MLEKPYRTPRKVTEPKRTIKFERKKTLQLVHEGFEPKFLYVIYHSLMQLLTKKKIQVSNFRAAHFTMKFNCGNAISITVGGRA